MEIINKVITQLYLIVFCLNLTGPFYVGESLSTWRTDNVFNVPSSVMCRHQVTAHECEASG